MMVKLLAHVTRGRVVPIVGGPNLLEAGKSWFTKKGDRNINQTFVDIFTAAQIWLVQVVHQAHGKLFVSTFSEGKISLNRFHNFTPLRCVHSLANSSFQMRVTRFRLRGYYIYLSSIYLSIYLLCLFLFQSLAYLRTCFQANRVSPDKTME